MTVLETPRMYFKGQITWDPITTNNYDSNYEEGIGQTILPGVADRVKVFREQAIEQVATGGNWNPDGTHRATFFETAVCGFDLGEGTETNDPFLKAAANFVGMLVDLEPFGSYSSQLFFDAMRFGVDGGYRIFAPRTSRDTARYINFGRTPRENSDDRQSRLGPRSPRRMGCASTRSILVLFRRLPRRSNPTMCSASRCALMLIERYITTTQI